MSSADGTTSYEIKCELIQQINNVYEDYNIKTSEETTTDMSIKELKDILKKLRKSINPKSKLQGFRK